MQNRNIGGANDFNIGTTSVFCKNLSGESSPLPPIPSNAFLLLDNSPFLLLDGSNFLLL